MEWLDRQVLTVAVMFLTGVALGLFFDLWGVATGRVTAPPGPAVGRRVPSRRHATGGPVFPVSDLLLWLLVTPVVFLAALLANRGELRSFIFVGIALGVAAYAVLARRVFVWAALEVRAGLLSGGAAGLRWGERRVVQPVRAAGARGARAAEKTVQGAAQAARRTVRGAAGAVRRTARGAAGAVRRTARGTARRLLGGFRRGPRNRPRG
jgi:hypothetical protein